MSTNILQYALVGIGVVLAGGYVVRRGLRAWFAMKSGRGGGWASCPADASSGQPTIKPLVPVESLDEGP